MTTEDPSYPVTNLYDGKYNTFAQNEGVDHPNGFIITIFLPFTTRISMIRIINRDDCCKDRMVGFSVFIVNKDGSEILCGSTTEEEQYYEFFKKGVGDKIEIRKEGIVGTVNLAEVEVYGVLRPGKYRLFSRLLIVFPYISLLSLIFPT